MDIPEDLKYTENHQWVRLGNGRTVRVGLTEHLVDRVATIVDLHLPAVGEEVAEGDIVGEVESDEDTLDLYSPVEGVVALTNNELADNTDLVLEDPYGDGWLFDVDLDEQASLDELLDVDGYADLVEA